MEKRETPLTGVLASNICARLLRRVRGGGGGHPMESTTPQGTRVARNYIRMTYSAYNGPPFLASLRPPSVMSRLVYGDDSWRGVSRPAIEMEKRT